MVKHTQTICWLLLTNCLSVFDHFMGLGLKELITDEHQALATLLKDHLARWLYQHRLIKLFLIFSHKVDAI